MEVERLHLYALPNEVFVQILSPLPTRSLLPLATVSRRFHDLVLRILHYRLLRAAALKEYKLMLECYHPGSKLSEPHVLCKYLGTDGLSDRHEGEGSLYEDLETAQKLGRLSSLYSRFHPEAAVEEKSSGTRLVPSTGGLHRLSNGAMPVVRTVELEELEDFAQLCTVVNLVKVMPGSHLLLSAIAIQEGIVRLWRDWLEDQAKVPSDETSGVEENVILPGGGVQSHRTVDELGTSDGHQMLWADNGRNVGLKLRVREKELDPNAAILASRFGERSEYEVEVEELHIRTTRLLLTVEQSIQEQKSQPRAVIFGAYHPIELIM